MTSPLVSIIIPCYNIREFVAESIESALSQTYSPKEVIVVDDGSTDGSWDVIRAFGPRIHCQSGPNRGACSARNAGLKMARGGYVQFHDADDILHIDKLEHSVSLALEKRVDVVISGVVTIWPDGRKETSYPEEEEHDQVIRALGREVGTPGYLLRTSIVRSIGGFRQGLPCAQERDLNLRLACSIPALSVAYLHEALVTCRKRMNGLSGNTIRVLEQYECIVPPCMEILRRQGTLTDARAHAMAGFMARAARVLYKLGQSGTANRYLSIARDIHPSGGLDLVYRRRILRWSAQFLGPEVTHKWTTAWRKGRSH